MPKIIHNLRESILEAAAHLLNEKGYEDFNMRDLAIRCKIGVGTVYNYFPHKTNLIQALSEDYWNRFFEDWDDRPEAKLSLYIQLRAITESMDIFVSRFMDYWLKSKVCLDIEKIQKVRAAQTENMISFIEKLIQKQLTVKLAKLQDGLSVRHVSALIFLQCSHMTHIRVMLYDDFFNLITYFFTKESVLR